MVLCTNGLREAELNGLETVSLLRKSAGKQMETKMNMKQSYRMLLMYILRPCR